MLPILQITHRPGIIDLGWGHPDPTLLPVDVLRQAADAALARHGPAALGYGAERGPGPLVEWICARVAATDGRAPAPAEVVVTAGASQALDLLCTLCARPGDVVLVESPCYHLAVRILRDHPLTLVPVPCDAGGLNPAALAEALAGLRRAGRAARLLYTIPTHHNPTGSCADLARRREIIALAEAAGLLLVEDDVYRELSYDAPAPPSLWSLAPPGVVARIGSFAKTLAPGLRLGYLTADAALASAVIGSGLLDSSGGVNHFTALVVAELCAAGAFDAQVARLRAAYRERRDVLAAGLRAHLPPGCGLRVPGGGFFQWVELPPGVDAGALLPVAEALGVAYLPGTRFYLGGGGSGALRLSFSLYPPGELAEAARRLGQAVAAAQAGG